MNKLWIAGLTLLLALTGCGDSGRDDASAPGRSGSGNPFLGQVDADTSYIYANLERMSDDLVDRFWTINEASSESMRQILESIAEDEEIPAPASALIEEMLSLTTRQGWEAAGLHANPYYAFHGVDMMPFASVEIIDGDAFAALITRIEDRLEQPLTRRSVEGTEYIWFEIAPGFGVALRHDESSFTIALVPDDAAALARFAGATSPTDPMSEQTLAAFTEDNDFLPLGSGFVDWQRAVARLMAGETPWLALTGVDQAELSEVTENEACVAEYRAITNALPRLSMGYTQLDTEGSRFVLRQETSADLGDKLAPIAQVPVSLDRDLNSLFQFGFALDLVKAREFARELVAGWVQNPPQCPSFAGIVAEAADWQQALNRPVPPMITNLQGAFITADQLELGPGSIPTGGGTLAVFMHNPQMLVGLAQGFSPAMAELNLQPGGDPQPVPPGTIPQLDQAGLNGWLGMGENAIGLAVGEDNVDRLSQSLAANRTDPYIIGARYDFDAFLELMNLAEGLAGDLGDDDTASVLEMQKAQYRMMAEIYDQGGFTVALTDRGIEFVGTVTFN